MKLSATACLKLLQCHCWHYLFEFDNILELNTYFCHLHTLSVLMWLFTFMLFFFQRYVRVYLSTCTCNIFFYKTRGRVFPEAEGYYHRAIFTVFILSFWQQLFIYLLNFFNSTVGLICINLLIDFDTFCKREECDARKNSISCHNIYLVIYSILFDVLLM